MMDQCVILCGGLGSRLGELTRSTPKPLLPVADEPFLEHLITEIARQGYRRFLLLAAFESQQIRTFAESSHVARRLGLEISIAVEPDRAGTGGALWYARDQLDDSFLLLNGDSWFDLLVADLTMDLTRSPETLAALSLRPIADASRYGVVELSDGRVTAFHSRPTGSGPGLVNGGVYAMRRAILDHVAPSCSLESDVLPQLAMQGRLAGRVSSGFFIDIGVPASYAEAQVTIPAQRRRKAVFFDRDGVLNHDHPYVGSPDRFEWMPGAREAIRAVNERGYYAFVVTNQAGIGRGYYTEADYFRLHHHMMTELAEIGAHLDDHRFCPYHPEARLEAYRQVSDWRKPGPGMLLDLMAHWPVSREGSFLIGNNHSDIEAARAAGVDGYLYSDGDLSDFLQKTVALA